MHNDLFSFDGIDDLVTEYGKPCKAVELIPDLKTTWPDFDVVQGRSDLRAKALAKPGPICFEKQPRLFDILLRFGCEPEFHASLARAFLHACFQLLAAQPLTFALQETFAARVKRRYLIRSQVGIIIHRVGQAHFTHQLPHLLRSVHAVLQLQIGRLSFALNAEVVRYVSDTG